MFGIRLTQVVRRSVEHCDPRGFDGVNVDTGFVRTTRIVDRRVDARLERYDSLVGHRIGGSCLDAIAYRGRMAFLDPVMAVSAAESMAHDLVDAWEVAPGDEVLVAYAVYPLDDDGKAGSPVFLVDCDGHILIDRLGEYV